MVRTEGTMGTSRRANMAITTAGDRLRKQRLTRQERRFSVNRGAEKFGIFPICSAKSQHKQCRSMSFSRQRLQPRLGFLEVGGVEALGEPAVDRREQVVRFLAFALLLPQAAQAHGR